MVLDFKSLKFKIENFSQNPSALRVPSSGVHIYRWLWFSGLFRLLRVEGATPDRQCQPGTNQHPTFPLGIPGSLFGCKQALLSTRLKDVQNLGATRLSFLLVFMLSLF